VREDSLLGLGLAPASDFSALAVVAQDAGMTLPAYVVRHLRRLPPGTAYGAIAADVARLVARPPLDYPVLAVDRTGVERAVADLPAGNTARPRDDFSPGRRGRAAESPRSPYTSEWFNADTRSDR
jgi:hypothetical protein